MSTCKCCQGHGRMWDSTDHEPWAAILVSDVDREDYWEAWMRKGRGQDLGTLIEPLDYERSHDFVPFSVFEENYDKCPFFHLRNEDEGCINIWKCNMCHRFMVFDTEPRVTRYMKRICVDDLPDNLPDPPCTEGYIYNNLFFKAVDEHYTRKWERGGRAFNYTWSYLCPRRIEEEVFSGKNGRYRDWWYCRNYADYIVFYGTRAMDVPLKAYHIYDKASFYEARGYLERIPKPEEELAGAIAEVNKKCNINERCLEKTL